MIGVVMAGGRGTRMMSTNGEKLLLPVPIRSDLLGAPQTKPVVVHVVDTLLGCGHLDEIVIVTSRNSPQTRNILLDLYGVKSRVRIADTQGEGYSADLGSVLAEVASNNSAEAALIVSGDMPLLDHQIIGEASSMYAEHAWVSVVVSKDCLNRLEMSLEYSVMVGDCPCYYTGVSVVDIRAVISDSIQYVHSILDDRRIAFTLNTQHDYDRLMTCQSKI